MPETTKTYANMEILQGADYTITITLDDASDTEDKNYLLTICKDFTGDTDFGGRKNGDGTSSSPFRTEITETNQATVGILTAPNNSNNKEIAINLYAVWTESLDDNFDGYWELAEKDTGVSPAKYTRIAQGEIYVSESASRYASTSA
tara:strand:- start:2064 stop:2504 length:441 start_codon:yes stop_codon:yes gene_type:complete